MSYPPNTPSLLSMLNSTGAKFIENQGHTALHRAMRANAAAGIVSAAAAVETVTKLDNINQSFVTLGNQLAQGQAADAQLEARVAALEKQADRLAHGLERLRAREHDYAHAVGAAHRFLVEWLDRNNDIGPTLALHLADASLFWLIRAPRTLEHTEFAGETLAQRIDRINTESGRCKGLVAAAADYAKTISLPDFTMDTTGSLQLDALIAPESNESEARAAIAGLAGLALWLFAMVALAEPPSPAGGPAAVTPGPNKGRPARSAA